MADKKQLKLKVRTDFIDEIYEYRGKWDVASKCGLMILKKPERHIVIASELYDENPGTSVNSWNCQLAENICTERGLDPEKLVFIEHTPDKGSKLENYRETFDRVIFKWDGKNFSDPDWEPMTRSEVEALIGRPQ